MPRRWKPTGPCAPSPGPPGLPSTLAAIRRGGAVALANKEALVCAGEVMLQAVRVHGATLLPVDSEHNAIFQAMADGNRDAVEKIVLTASGGPFRLATREEMARARPEEALRHPVWSMGAKISIDSATMMNKGLELIEAARLFDMPSEQIEVLVHPQSVVPWHGLLPATAACWPSSAVPDMRVPIAPHAGLAVAHRHGGRRGWISPYCRGSTSRRQTPAGSPRCGCAATLCRPAVGRQRS